MHEIKIAKRYAKALLRSINNDLKRAEKYLDFFTAIKELFDEKKFKKVLVSPAIPADVKASMLNYAIDKVGQDNEFKKFISEVVAANRVDVIPHIETAMHQLVNEAKGVVDATVYSVTPLSNDDLTNLAKQLETMQKRKVILEQKVDKTILGGLIVKVGNSLLDLSLRTRLESLAHNAAR